LLRLSFIKGADTRYVSLEIYAPKDLIITLDKEKENSYHWEDSDENSAEME
jgi:hypothetical protein